MLINGGWEVRAEHAPSNDLGKIKASSLEGSSIERFAIPIKAFLVNVLEGIGNPLNNSSGVPPGSCFDHECQRCLEDCPQTREFKELVGADAVKQVLIMILKEMYDHEGTSENQGGQGSKRKVGQRTKAAKGRNSSAPHPRGAEGEVRGGTLRF